jgi:polyferredoxin
VIVFIGAVLMFSPVFVAKSLIERFGFDISLVAIGALAVFLIGTYLVLQFARD